MFEAIPQAEIKGADEYAEPAKIVFDDTFTPQISYQETQMTELYIAEDDETYRQNLVYDFGNRRKINVEQKNVSKGAASATVSVNGLKNRIEYIAIQIQSLTGSEHGSVYDNTLEDHAMKLISKIIIKNLQTPTGAEIKTFDLTNDIQHRVDQRELYGAFRRFVNGSPVTATNTALKHTEYMRNMPTEKDYWSRRDAAKANQDDCYPIIIDCSDSKGLFNNTQDNTKYTTPTINIELVFKQNLDKNYNIVITTFQTGKYVLSDLGKIPSIKKI